MQHVRRVRDGSRWLPTPCAHRLGGPDRGIPSSDALLSHRGADALGSPHRARRSGTPCSAPDLCRNTRARLGTAPVRRDDTSNPGRLPSTRPGLATGEATRDPLTFARFASSTRSRVTRRTPRLKGVCRLSRYLAAASARLSACLARGAEDASRRPLQPTSDTSTRGSSDSRVAWRCRLRPTITAEPRSGVTVASGRLAAAKPRVEHA